MQNLETQISNFSADHFNEYRNLQEHIDNPEFPIHKKVSILYGLHLKNKIFGTYKKLYQSILPVIKTINLEENRPARILEIASGLGFLTFGFWEEVSNKAQLELTGSDIVPEYVRSAQIKADLRHYPIQFKVLDALNLPLMHQEEPYDLIINLHSLHHFTPYQLAQIFRASNKMATRGFYAIDGATGFWNFFFMGVSAFFPTFFRWDYCYLHDALLSSRRMYSNQFLKGCATIAIGTDDAQIEVGKRSIGLNFISIMKKR